MRAFGSRTASDYRVVGFEAALPNAATSWIRRYLLRDPAICADREDRARDQVAAARAVLTFRGVRHIAGPTRAAAYHIWNMALRKLRS